MTKQRPEAGFSEPAVRDALMRLQGRFAASRDPVAAREATGGLPVMSADAALRHAAAILQLTATRSIGSPNPDVTSTGPASIAVAAEALGMEVHFEQRGIAALTPAELPCLVLGMDGEACLLVGTSAPGMVLIVDPSGPQQVPVSQVQAFSAGTIVRLARQETSGAAPERIETSSSGQGPSSAGLPTDRGGDSTLIRALRRSLGSQRPLLTQLIMASLVINLLGMSLPLFSMAVFDRVIPHAAFETLWALALGVCLALAVELALRAARLKLFDAAGQSISQDLQGRMMSRLLGAPTSALPNGSAAAIQPAQDLDNMAHVAPQLAVSLLVDLPFFIVLLMLIASIGGPVVFVAIGGTVLLVAVHVLAHLLAAGRQGEHGSLQRRTQQLIVDSVAAQERIRLTGAGAGLLARWDFLADSSGYAAHRLRYWHGFAAQAAAVIVQAVIVGTLVWGVFRIDAAAMTIGGLSAVMLLVNRAMTPVSIATGLLFRAKQCLQQTAPLDPLLTAPLEAGGDRRADGRDRIVGRIDIRGAAVRHPGDQREALRDINLTIRPGERVGIIGRSGCGKSTLLKLMVRLVEPAQGAVQLDERDIRHYDPRVLRRAVAAMPQDSALVDGSLEDNLTLGLGAVDPARFTAIAQLTGVADIARSHPEGYSQQVGPGGKRLSGGERQLVSLARALMGEPSLLLLDEPTAALDNTAEARLINELRQLPQACGVVVATHRMQVLSLVDRVIWLDGGRIVADGPKAEIFQKIGIAA